MEHHIEKLRFKESLTEEEISHISSCRFCREELTGHVEQYEMLTAPKNLKASILEQSKHLDVQLIAGTNQISKRLQLFYFSLKVSAAILCMLSMLTVAPHFLRQLELGLQEARDSIPAIGQSAENWQYYERVENLTARLYELSNSNVEEYDYDKKEK